MKHYFINGQIEGSTWDDFFSDDGSNATISLAENGNPEKIEIDDDGWYEVEISTFDLETVIIVLALINECEPEDIALEERKLVASI